VLLRAKLTPTPTITNRANIVSMRRQKLPLLAFCRPLRTGISVARACRGNGRRCRTCPSVAGTPVLARVRFTDLVLVCCSTFVFCLFACRSAQRTGCAISFGTLTTLWRVFALLSMEFLYFMITSPIRLAIRLPTPNLHQIAHARGCELQQSTLQRRLHWPRLS
jgi:hypothetical protein